MTNRDYYIHTYQQDDSMQALNVGTGFDFTKPIKNKKAEVIINALSGCHIGYKLDYKNLCTKRFKKWASGAAWFTTGDMLSPTDVKQAIREFYRRVATGELSWATGERKMLELTRLTDGTTELKVSTFIEGLFTDTSKIEKVAENKVAEDVKEEKVTQKDVEAMLEEIDVIASIEAMLQSKIGVGERAVLQKALDDLKIMTRKSA